MSSVPLPPVLPCVAFNQSTCFSEHCGYSHLPDSFSLGSGGRNVCLLHLISRCDGWGCSYSHSREELAWTDDEIKYLIRCHLQLIDAYNGRVMRNPYPFHPITSFITPPAPWTRIAAPQAYPTPSASVTIEPTITDQQAFGEPHAPRIASWSPGDLSGNEEDEPAQPFLAVVEVEPESTYQGVADGADVLQGSRYIVTPQPAIMNPLAAPFVPLECNPPAPLTMATPETSPPAVDGIEPTDINRYCTPLDIPNPLANDHEGVPDSSEQEVKVEKPATAQDINAWVPTGQGEPASWDDAPANDRETSPKGGGWDDGPTEDAVKTPPRNVISPASVPSKDARISFKGKGKGRTWKEEKREYSKAESTKPASPEAKRWPTPSYNQERASSRKHERVHSAPTKPSAKPRSIMVVPHVSPNVVDEGSRERTPHAAPEIEDDEKAKSYRIAIPPGSIIPEPDIAAKIIKANLQLARAKVLPSHPVPAPINEITEVDPGINWVNGGSSRFSEGPDPPREFSQRSRASGSTWGKKKELSALSEGEDGESN